MKIRNPYTRLEFLQMAAEALKDAHEAGYQIYNYNDLATYILRRLQNNPRLKLTYIRV